MRGELPSSIDLAAYRIVEETLTLATTGRIVPLTIAICYADNSVELRLQAELPSSAWPSESMRERAAICHGTLRVDADGPGGSRLVARLPRALQGSLR